MRASQYAQERASMSTNNSFPSQLVLVNQTSLKMYNEKAKIHHFTYLGRLREYHLNFPNYLE